MQGPQQGPPPGAQVENINVRDEYLTKHFCFQIAEDGKGTAEAKSVGDWLSRKALEGYDLVYKQAEFIGDRLHVFVSVKRLVERKLATPPGVISTKTVQRVR